MRPQTISLVLLLAASVIACGREPLEPGPWFTRTLAPQTTINGVRILHEVDDLGLDSEDVRGLLAEVRRVHPGAEITALVATRTHPGEGAYFVAEFAPHKVADRMRWRHVLGVARASRPGDLDAPTGRWRAESGLRLLTEVCGPGRSFRGGTPVPEDQVMQIRVGAEVSIEDLLPILEAAQPQIPADEMPMSLHRQGDVYELETVTSRQVRGLSGSTLEAARAGDGWQVKVTGRWVS